MSKAPKPANTASLIAANITCIGAGKMAEALVAGLLRKKVVRASQITVTDIKKERLAYFSRKYRSHTQKNNQLAVKGKQIIVLAVKPQLLPEVLKGIAPFINNSQLVISIAAGIKVNKIERYLKHSPIVRCMPNNPCLIGQGITALSYNSKVTTKQKILARKIFSAVGKAVEVPEKYLDAVTGLSGSGPAFVYRMLQGLKMGGVKAGLPFPLARELAIQTVIGSAKMLAASSSRAQKLIEMVTSPGGTTLAGLKIIDEQQVARAIAKAVLAATKRSRTLSR